MVLSLRGWGTRLSSCPHRFRPGCDQDQGLWMGRFNHIIGEYSRLSHSPILAILRSWKWEDSGRSEEHTSELQSLMRISYAVFCLKKKNKYNNISVQNLDTI